MIIIKERTKLKERKLMFLLDKDVYSRKKAEAYTREELEEIVREGKYEGYEMSIISLVVEPNATIEGELLNFKTDAYWVLVFKF